jgi:hypothetical protein
VISYSISLFQFEQNVDWSDIQWIKREAPNVPLVVKGVMTAEDADWQYQQVLMVSWFPIMVAGNWMDASQPLTLFQILQQWLQDGFLYGWTVEFGEAP